MSQEKLIERREALADVQVDGRKIVGYAAVFGDVADLGDFDERIEPGAFTAALADSRAGGIVALYNHDANHVLGRLDAGTLKIREDKRGLFVEISPPNTQFARDLRKSIERGDVRGQSFQFETLLKNTRWEMRGERATRVVRQFDRIIDVGPVTVPAYRATTASLRSLADWRSEADRLAAAEARLARLESRLTSSRRSR